MSAGKRAINCKEFHESLAAYLDDRLTPDERDLIEAHLSACRQCSEELDAAVGMHDRIIKISDTLSRRIVPSDVLWFGVKQQLTIEAQHKATARELVKTTFEGGRRIVMKALLSKQPVWKLAAINGMAIVALIIGLGIGLPSKAEKSVYAQAEDIVQNSPEVIYALGGAVDSEVAISVADGGVASVICSRTTGEMAAVTVNIANASVGSVVVCESDEDVIELTEDEKQNARKIAEDDPEIKALFDEGAEIVDMRALGSGAPIVKLVWMTIQLGDEIHCYMVDLVQGIVDDMASASAISDPDLVQ
jgi:anti-sigma factor RsiW